jgi:hypothetical protein
MDAGKVFALVAVVVVLIGVAAFWAHLRRGVHPEDTASHDTSYSHDRRDEERMAPYPGMDRPAGPGAEGMAVPADGVVTTGPEPPNDQSGLAPDANLSHGRATRRTQDRK